MRSVALLLLPIAAGCASINPMLVPARVLSPGAVAVELGSGYVAPVVDSSLPGARDAANHVAAGSVDAHDRTSLERAAMAFGATPSGLAPYVSARVGLGARSEGHLAMVGRQVRLGARRVFWASGDVWALALGIQARGALWADPFGSAVPMLTVTGSRVLGGDVTAAIGRTSSGIYDFWLGLRAGYTRGDSHLQFASATGINGGSPFDVAVDRFDMAATLGLRVGFGHFAAIAEIEGALGVYQGHASTGDGLDGVVFSLVPAAAVSWAF